MLAVSLLVLLPACLLEEPGELVLDRSPDPTPAPEPTFSPAEVGQHFGDAVWSTTGAGARSGSGSPDGGFGREGGGAGRGGIASRAGDTPTSWSSGA